MSGAMIFDILLLAVFAYCVYKGMRNGFVRSIASLLATVLAIFVAIAVVNAFSEPVAQNLIIPPLERLLDSRLSSGLGKESAEALETIVDKVEEGLGKLTGSETGDGETSGVTPPLSGARNQESEETKALTVSGRTAAMLGGGIASILVFIVAFALVLAILRVLIDSLRVLDKIPVVGAVNTGLGILLGAVTGFAVLIVPIWLLQSVLPDMLGVQGLLPQALLEESWVLGIVSVFYRVSA